MREPLTDQDDPRGTIVAAVNDAGDAFAGIVVAGWTAEHGEDVWRVRDAHGEEADFLAGQCVVIDDARIAELRAALSPPTDDSLVRAVRRACSVTLSNWATREAIVDELAKEGFVRDIDARLEAARAAGLLELSRARGAHSWRAR